MRIFKLKVKILIYFLCEKIILYFYCLLILWKLIVGVMFRVVNNNVDFEFG